MTQAPPPNAQPAAQPPQPPPPPAGYEFTPQQDSVIRLLSRKMRFVGLIYIVASGLIGIAGLIVLFFKPLVGVLYLILLTPELLIGLWTVNAASSFRLVTDTRGHDIPHLMNSLTSLKKLYTLMFWLFIVGFGLMVVAIVAGILLFAMGVLPPSPGSGTFTMLG